MRTVSPLTLPDMQRSVYMSECQFGSAQVVGKGDGTMCWRLCWRWRSLQFLEELVRLSSIQCEREFDSEREKMDISVTTALRSSWRLKCWCKRASGPGHKGKEKEREGSSVAS